MATRFTDRPTLPAPMPTVTNWTDPVVIMPPLVRVRQTDVFLALMNLDENADIGSDQLPPRLDRLLTSYIVR